MRSFVPEFVYKYSSKHADVLEKYKSIDEFKKNFIITSELENEFYQYAQAQGLKSDVAKEKKAEEKLKLNLKAFFAKQIWRMDGYYNISNVDDKVIAKAVEALK